MATIGAVNPLTAQARTERTLHDLIVIALSELLAIESDTSVKLLRAYLNLTETRKEK